MNCSNSRLLYFLILIIPLLGFSSENPKFYFLRVLKTSTGVEVVEIKTVNGRLKTPRKPEIKKAYGDFEAIATGNQNQVLWNKVMENPQRRHARVDFNSPDNQYKKQEILEDSTEFVLRIPYNPGFNKLQFFHIHRNVPGQNNGLWKRTSNKKLLGEYSFGGSK